jgi:ketosteroid isomerase-like protein
LVVNAVAEADLPPELSQESALLTRKDGPVAAPSHQIADRLRGLAALYAAGVDRRDRDMFLSAFTSDGRLRVFNPGDSPEPTGEMNGHEELARVMKGIAVYDRTHHFVGNALYEVDDQDVASEPTSATGEVYCVAHHLTRGRHGGTDHVMYIRYADEYRRDEAGEWKISDRQVLVDWTDTHHADPERVAR